MNKIVIKNLAVAYDTEPVIWNINLEIKKSKMTAIVGPNGAGKSTLLKAILGLEKTLIGEIKILENDELSYVPQKSTVDWDFPTTVFDVVLMGRYKKISLFRRPSKKDKEIALEAIKKVELENFKDRQINSLSGGQKQRVFLARAIAMESDLYLLDEPFQGVDAYSEKMIVNILKQLTKEGKTIIVVHHDLQTINKYFQDVVLINKNVIAYGNVEDTFIQSNVEETYKVRASYFEEKEKNYD